MFRRAYKYKSTDEATSLFPSLPPKCRRLFPHVEQLLRLLLLLPVSSASSERSFSGLRRLKSWLRTTMTQQRLNHIAVPHTHLEELDALDTTTILSEFVSASDIRSSIFGHYRVSRNQPAAETYVTCSCALTFWSDLNSLC